MSLMVSISGIRGIVGESLTPDVVVKYVSAYAEYCNRGPIVIGRDGRITGKSIGHIVSSTLLQMGCDVLAIGVCPTPTVQLAVERLHAAGGISITASHNPMQWNGLKFLASTGLFLDADENRSFWQIADRPTRRYQPWNKQGTWKSIEHEIQKHVDDVLHLPYISVEAIRKRKFKVVLDCVNAAGGAIVPSMLRVLGCDVIEMNCDQSGIFAHTPEPIPENLTTVFERVKKEHADLGIVVDPDVDRLVLVTEHGEPFGEEYTVTSATHFVLSKSPRGEKVAVNFSTTRAIDDVAKVFGATVERTPVGEINVAKRMKEIGAVVGGEGSGGVILPRVHLGRDAVVGIALILQQLAEFGGSISEFKRTLPQYSIVKGKVELGALNADSILNRLAKHYASAGRITAGDGLKIDFLTSWVHLRKSNTEPIIRIIAEAPTSNEANDLVKKFIGELTTP
ncbi:MAG: phosphoglucosamine mutase [Ignavibacteriales bacterium]|nr:phosphoglucosamine mutase [Ignavibacteriales bacterium]